MNALNAAQLINLVGFLVGMALYFLLGFMVIRHYRASREAGVNGLLLATAGLGLFWNLGELFITIQRDFGEGSTSSLIAAAAYSSLGFLPSVVVHSAQREAGRRGWITYLAYTLSFFAAALHFRGSFNGDQVPSALAMQSLTVGAISLAVLLLVFNFRETLERKAIWAAALLIFAMSSLHLSAERSENSWLVELVSHQSSLPLALVILYQNFRFAFADLFLKRAISLLLLAAFSFVLYVAVAAPLLHYHESHDRNDVFAVTIILGLWVTTALIYPMMHAAAVWFVDKVLLKRADYDRLQSAILKRADDAEYTAEILDAAGEEMARALTAERMTWKEAEGKHERSETVSQREGEVRIKIPTAIPPEFEITFAGLGGGRRLLSGETSMLEAIALVIGRRIDSVRVIRERHEREIKEKEYATLATEAQLTALRSQMNPHFLFNALTTIGNLVQSAPEKAVDTLLTLTKLLRGLLSSTKQFSTLGDEILLIDNYLEIEAARFEERLSVDMIVPKDLLSTKIPSLILQPLVENAVKHGISANSTAGKVTIKAESHTEGDGKFLRLEVTDPGSSKRRADLDTVRGFGLSNVEKRLATQYGSEASFRLYVNDAGRTAAEIVLPIRQN